MQYTQIKLQRGYESDELVEFQTPICSSFEGGLCTIYRIVGSSGGQSDESGELLCHRYVRKEVYSAFEIQLAVQELSLYVDARGDAYRSWKGRLRGHPVCNFKTGYIYKYVRPKTAQVRV